MPTDPLRASSARRPKGASARVQTTGRLLNEQPLKGWARIHSPRYFAVEVADEPGIFVCPARGAGQWTAEQLQGWAELVGAEVVLVEWPAASGKQAEGKRR